MSVIKRKQMPEKEISIREVNTIPPVIPQIIQDTEEERIERIEASKTRKVVWSLIQHLPESDYICIQAVNNVGLIHYKDVAVHYDNKFRNNIFHKETSELLYTFIGNEEDALREINRIESYIQAENFIIEEIINATHKYDKKVACHITTKNSEEDNIIIKVYLDTKEFKFEINDKDLKVYKLKNIVDHLITNN